ncbi:MAG: shikimate dehydrogenase [Caulobacterales bacterium 32-69-10]|nr:MAG: shikimate dehydrogenase [Caulobacterales bacterium 32-69-10]
MSLLSGKTMVGGVVGHPVAHSLSPRIHSQWLADAGIDGAYVPFPVAEDGFERFVDAMRGGVIRGVNVTIPFKEVARRVADRMDDQSQQAGASNLLLFHADGTVEARNTDGFGLTEALRQDAGYDFAAGPVVVLGAGGAARGAAAALIAAGVPEMRLVNRTGSKAADLAKAFPRTYPFAWADMARALEGASAVVNATAGGLNGEGDLDLPLDSLPGAAVVMDMVYKPLETGLLKAAKARGLGTVDGLSMLINQAVPSFEALFGQAPPKTTDARAVALAMLK